MALCADCGGGFDFYPLLRRPPVPPVEPDPFCPDCGQRRYTPCPSCQGEGYVLAEGTLLHGYCTSCGKKIVQQARVRCRQCQGEGRLGHFCNGRIWVDRGFRRERAVPLFIVYQSSRTTLTRAPRRTLVRR